MRPVRLALVPLLLLCLLLGPGGSPARGDSPATPPAPAGAVTGMDHLLLTVADLERSVRFYRDVLGLRLEYRLPEFVMLRAGDYGVALSSHPWPFEKQGEPRGVGVIPHFTTPDMAAFAARLQAAGVAWLRGPVRESFGIEAFVQDPDGYQWAVVAPLEPAGP